MADIRLGAYRLRSDPQQWIVSEVKTYQSGKLAGQEYDHGETFHGTLQQAISALLQRSLRDSEATELRELIGDMNAFRGEILKLLGVR
jgi:hypothetical protein